MLQEINLLGIRKQTILCHFEKICDLAVMKEITETDEKNIDKGLRFNTGTQFIERDKIILYGEIDFNNKDMVKLIKRIDLDSNGYFLNKAKNKYPNHQVNIYSSDIKEQLSATISKQISLARTMSVRNLIKKFGYEKKDIKIDLTSNPELKESVDATNGYLVIKIVK